MRLGRAWRKAPRSKRSFSASSAGAKVSAVAARDSGTAALVNHASADDGHVDVEVHQIGVREREGIARQHDKIGESVGFDDAGVQPGEARSLGREKRERVHYRERFGRPKLDPI